MHRFLPSYIGFFLVDFLQVTAYSIFLHKFFPIVYVFNRQLAYQIVCHLYCEKSYILNLIAYKTFFEGFLRQVTKLFLARRLLIQTMVQGSVPNEEVVSYSIAKIQSPRLFLLFRTMYSYTYTTVCLWEHCTFSTPSC